MIIVAVLLTVASATQPAQTGYLTDSGPRYNSSCNAIDLGIACDLACREEGGVCSINCGRDLSDPAVQECKEACYNHQFSCIDGELTISK